LIVTGESWSLSGNGDLNRTQLSVLQTLDDGQTHNFRFYYTEPAGDLHYQGYYQGPAIITSLEITGNDSQYGTIAISLESDGQWTFTVV
jgi:predicted secreted protein